MKYCTICKINVDENLDNCPLCGSFLQADSPILYENYEKNIQPYVTYPTITVKEKVDFLRNRISKLIMLATIICVALDCVFEPKGLSWSPYVIVGAILFLVAVLMPIIKKMRVHNQVMLDLPFFVLGALFIELIITKFTSANVALTWLIPSFFICGIVASDAMIIATANKKEVTGYFTTLLYCTVYPIIYQILMWSISSLGQQDNLYSVVIFFAALLNLGTVIICCFGRLKAEYMRKLNL